MLQQVLVRPQSLTVKQIQIVPSTVRIYASRKLCKKQTRSQTFVILEWARANPTEISEFLRRMGSDVNFQKFYRHMYDPLRHIYRRIFNYEALCSWRRVQLLQDYFRSKGYDREGWHISKK